MQLCGDSKEMKSGRRPEAEDQVLCDSWTEECLILVKVWKLKQWPRCLA